MHMRFGQKSFWNITKFCQDVQNIIFLLLAMHYKCPESNLYAIYNITLSLIRKNVSNFFGPESRKTNFIFLIYTFFRTIIKKTADGYHQFYFSRVLGHADNRPLVCKDIHFPYSPTHPCSDFALLSAHLMSLFFFRASLYFTVSHSCLATVESVSCLATVESVESSFVKHHLPKLLRIFWFLRCDHFIEFSFLQPNHKFRRFWHVDWHANQCDEPAL